MMLKKFFPVFACFVFLLATTNAQSKIAVGQMNPFVEAGDLRLEIILFNNGDADGTATVKFDYFGQPFEPSNESVPKNSSKRLVYNIKNIKPGKIILAIFSDKNKFYEITIPENLSQNGELAYREIGSQTYSESNQKNEGLPGIIDFIAIALKQYFLLVVAIIGIAIAAIFLILKTLKKSKLDKQIEINEVLLQEADEIQKNRKTD